MKYIKKTESNVFKKSYECFEWFGIYIRLRTNYIYTTHSKHTLRFHILIY